VVGFDDSPLAAAAHPAITTVRQPIVDMGSALATRLLHAIDGGDVPEPLVMATEVILRDSA
jgi:DNA-binding LacI/PurR family transcriptional regulator